jgi:2'-5' RNA ligase
VNARRDGAVREEVRAFFAIDLDDAVREAAAGVARLLQRRPGGDGVRWVRPEALHVTLRFLGNVETSRLPALVECVAREVDPLAPFASGLGMPRLFPTVRRPRVVVLELVPEEPIAGLAGAVERGVVAAGFESEDRPFRAHLTLGRVRQRRFPATEGLAAPEADEFQVREAVLFRSELHPSGARYTPLERLSLGGSGNHPN